VNVAITDIQHMRPYQLLNAAELAEALSKRGF
jgi:hypothetical protein